MDVFTSLPLTTDKKAKVAKAKESSVRGFERRPNTITYEHI